MPLPKSIAIDVERFQMFLDALHIAFYVKDAQGTLLFVNKAFEEILGVPFEVLRTSWAGSPLTPEQQAWLQTTSAQAFAAGQAQIYEATYWSAKHAQQRKGLTWTNPIYDAHGQPLYLLAATLDTTDQKQLQMQIDSERQMLQMLVGGADLPKVLDAFARSYEAAFSGLMCSILLLDADGQHLRHGAGPSLPLAYCQAIDGLTIGQGVGSCGTAAYTGRETLVSNIANDPLWHDYRDLALSHQLRACWSVPIISSKGQVLGTFANYHATPRTPQPDELQAIRRGAYLAGLAIEHHQTEQLLIIGQELQREAALHTQTILNNMADGVITINAQGVIESYNKAASVMFGYEAEEVLGRNVSMLMPEPHRSLHDHYLAQHQRTGQAHIMGKVREMDGLRKNGSTFPMSLIISKISGSGQTTYIGLLRDITQQRRDEEEIRRLAFYDPLTGLPNRRLLMDRLKQAMVTSARTGEHGCVMFLDLDHFKQLNDTLGHDVGDELLQQVAQRLNTCVRECDSVARLGGDEFVVLLEALSPQGLEAAAQAETVAHKILDALGRPYRLRGHDYVSTPSIGIVVFTLDQESMEDLLKKADVAMYQAKSAGRNTACFFDPEMQAAASARAELEKDMRLGLARQEFTLHYQVQVNNDGRYIGAEALVRWNHPVRGMVSPAHFIPLAETTGMILPLGQWVLETACQQLVDWSHHPATAHWTLAVNVSAHQFLRADFVATVVAALQKTGARPKLLKLELTESMLVDDMESVISKMNQIKALGVGFSLDDFGTGYSSLSYLKRLPLDQLKIDQSFVRDVLTDPSDAVIARTVVALGHSMGLRVIAEGVETVGQYNFLAEAGCDAFQGFYFGRPSPPEALESKEKTIPSP